MLDQIDFALTGVALLVLLAALVFIVIIWSAALGHPIG